MKIKLLSERDCAKACGIPIPVLQEYRKTGHLRPALYRLKPWGKRGVKRLVPFYYASVVKGFLQGIEAQQKEIRKARKEQPLKISQPLECAFCEKLRLKGKLPDEIQYRHKWHPKWIFTTDTEFPG